VIAAATALNVVEIGTGAGCPACGCCTAHPARLTTIDKEPEHLAAARTAFADAKLPARARFITGRASDVLPRMNEASYDIVLVDADPRASSTTSSTACASCAPAEPCSFLGCSPAARSPTRCGAIP
jgi:predicted O-methyltransferase YrrM